MKYASLYQGEKLADKIVRRYEGFNVQLAIKDIEVLEDRFKFRVKPHLGIKINDIRRFEKDVQIGLKLPLFRVIQEDLTIFIIASRELWADYSWHRLLRDPKCLEAFKNMEIAHPLGFNALGEAVIMDLTKYPHAIIAGTTGSGKSVFIKNLLVSLLGMYSPSRVNLLLCDMAGELVLFDDFPHLSHPVIQDFDTFLCAMMDLKCEMERRIKLKGSDEYSNLPHIICVADEFTSFVAGTDEKSKLCREIITEILRRGRHAKIHMVLVAHNPTQQRLKLDISDIPTKMAFKVARQSNSLAVLSEGGAEDLSGDGDMLLKSSKSTGIERIQGAFISDRELEQILFRIRLNWERKFYDAIYKFTVSDVDLQQRELKSIGNFRSEASTVKRNIDDNLFAKVAVWALGQDSISCNMISEIFNVGWRRANRFIGRLHEWGIVEDLDAKLPRKVLPQSIGEITNEIVEFMVDHGFSCEAISNAICNRKND